MSKEAVEVAPNSKEELQKQYTSFQDILSDEEFDKMAKKHQVESERERKLWLKPFFWLMVFSSATPSARGSLLQMIGFFLGAALLLFPEKKMSSLTKGAVSQHLKGTSWYFFRRVYNHLLVKCENILGSEQKKYLGKFKDVFAIDGSVIALCSRMSKIFASVHKDKASLKLNTKFSIRTAALTKLQVGSGRRHDSKFAFVTQAAGILYIVDLGYWSFGLMQKIIDAGSFFVLRLKSNCNPLIVRVVHKDYPHLVGKRLSEINDFLAQQTGCGKIDLVVQLSSAKKPRFQAEIRLVGLFHEDVWHFYVTNIFDIAFTPQHIYDLYAARWQVEIFFDIIKNVLALQHIISRTKNGIMVEIYSALIFHLLTLILIAITAKQENRSIHEFSFEGTFKVLQGVMISHFHRFLQPSLAAVDEIFQALIRIISHMGLSSKPLQTFSLEQQFHA